MVDSVSRLNRSDRADNLSAEMSNPPPVDSQSKEQGSTDSLGSLHKMSRTAGLSGQEYVAVNATAVAALLLGLVSSAAVMADILLILPLATLVVAIVAIIQVRNSGGTQTGQGLAIGGLILAIVFCGFVGGNAIAERQTINAEKGEIANLISQLGTNISKGDYDAAWDQFGPAFTAGVKKETFKTIWAQNQANPLYGHISGMHWNGFLDVQIDKESGVRIARGYVIMDLDGGRSDKRSTIFRKIPDRGWVIESIESYFPQAQPAAGQ